MEKTKYCSGDQIEKNRMGGACSVFGEEERCIQGFWWENARKRGHLGYPGVDGEIILRSMFRKWDVGAWTRVIWFRIGTVSGHL